MADNITLSSQQKVYEKFWLDDPCSLFSSFNFLPLNTLTLNEKLNALTRIAIIIAIILYCLDYSQWLIFLLISLVVIILLKYVTLKKEPENKESFTLTPTYTGLDLQQTTVAPLFSEEWQIYPPTYDLYVEEPLPTEDLFEIPLHPQSYPFGQVLSVTNLLPNDEYHTRMLNGGVRESREYMNSAFLRNDLAFRDNLTRVYKKSLARRFRNSCNDSFSPYSGY